MRPVNIFRMRQWRADPSAIFNISIPDMTWPLHPFGWDLVPLNRRILQKRIKHARN